MTNDCLVWRSFQYSTQYWGYTWEPFITEVFKNEGLITLQNQFVNFAVNGDRRGVYALEEVPSSLTIERNKRKSGPIFGLNEDYGTNIDSLLDPYDKKSWEGTKLYNFAHQNLKSEFFKALNGENLAKIYSILMNGVSTLRCQIYSSHIMERCLNR